MVTTVIQLNRFWKSHNETHGDLFARNHVYLTEKRVPKSVVPFGWNGVDKEVAVLAEAAPGIGDTDAVLPARTALFGSRVYGCNEFPATGCGIGLGVGSRIEFWITSIRSKQV